jgi:hypothetical protein
VFGHAACAAAQRAGQDCHSDYWWAVTLPLEVLAAAADAESDEQAQADTYESWAQAPPPPDAPPPPPTPPPPPALSVTLRAGASFSDAVALGSRFPVHSLVSCTVDGAGGVSRVGDNATTTATTHHAHDDSAHAAAAAAAAAGPLAVLLLHAAWCVRCCHARPRTCVCVFSCVRNALRAALSRACLLAPVCVRREWLLDRVGAAPRPPPAWLSQLGALPWARCVAPAVPLLTLPCLSAAARCAQRGGKGTLSTLSMFTMTAAAAEAASAILTECARLRAARGAPTPHLLAAVAYCAAGALCLGACVATPALKEARRALAVARTAVAEAERRQRGDAAGSAALEARESEAPHPLGEPLWACGADGRPVTRALAARLEAAAATDGRHLDADDVRVT